MQTIKIENNCTPEKRAQNREKMLLTYVINATARDQEKNTTISKLQREISEVVEDYEMLKAEVKLKDKILYTKEDELMILKSENESLKRQMQLLLTSKRSNDIEMKTSQSNDDKNFLKPAAVPPAKANAVSPAKSPKPEVSRKRSIKKTKDPAKEGVTGILYNLRKKSKK